MTIVIGWWAVPLLITLGSLGTVWFWDRAQPPSHGYGAAGAGVISALAFGAALILSLVAWLIWALVR